MLVDSHAHLDSTEFENDRNEVILNSGLDYILNVATDLNSAKLSFELVERYDFIYFSAGIHPHNAGKEDFTKFKEILNNPKLKAIGEIGLDYYRDHAPREKQKKIFRSCLKEAVRHNLPVIIHQRNAQKEVLGILREFSVKGVMHCFSGTIEYAEECLDMGFHISFAGNITYPKADNLRNIAKMIPLDRLLIETDCPWLSPQPVRGKRNEPSFVKYVAEELAQIKSLSLEETGRITGENFKRLFRISPHQLL